MQWAGDFEDVECLELVSPSARKIADHVLELRNEICKYIKTEVKKL